MAENDSEWNASCALQKTFLGARQTFPKESFSELPAASDVIHICRSKLSPQPRILMWKRLGTKLRYRLPLRKNSQLTALLTLQVPNNADKKTYESESGLITFSDIFLIDNSYLQPPLSNPSLTDKIKRSFPF